MRSIRSTPAFRRAALLALPTFLTIFFACSDDGVGPPATRAAGIAKLNGDVQVGVVGRALPDSLVVKVTDKAGKAVAGVPVLWEITAGGGQAAGAAVTSSAGEAKASWTLGTVAGANALVVRAGAAPAISFQATAEAGAPAELELVLDSLVLTTPGEAVQVSAAVRDSFENVVAAPALTYAVSDTMVARVSASGMVTAKATGDAALTVSAASVQQTIPVRVRLAVTAVELSADAATLNAIGDTVLLSAVARNAAGGIEAATLTWTSSNGNIASVTAAGEVVGHSVGTALIMAAAGGIADTTVIEVRQVLASVSASVDEATIAAGDSVLIAITAADSNGVAVGAATVAWTSGDSAIASVSPAGVVRGAKAGSAQITATVTAPASPEFSAIVDVSVLPAAPTGVVMVWGDGQGATIGGRLSDSLVVRVTDPFGNAVPDQMVRWSIVTGGGSVSADSTETNANGETSVIWTLGMTPGENTLTASAGTGSVTFMANAAQAVTPAGGSISAPEQVATVTVPPNAVSVTTPITVAPAAEFPADPDLVEGTVFDFGPDGTQFSEPVTITLKFDADALPAGTIAEELFLVHGENGSWTLLENRVADMAAGVITGTITHFSPVGVVRRASKLELLIDSADVVVGETIDIDALLRAVPPYSDVTTTVNPEHWESSDDLIATVDGNGVVTALAAGTVTITATHGEGRTATATIVVTEPTARSLEIVSGNGGTFPAGDEAPDSLVVRALDADGAPVSGVVVTWHVTAGGGSVSPASSTTNANGEVATQLTLGAATADNLVQARVEGVDTAFFTVRGETAALDSVAAHSDTTLSAIVNTNVTEDPAVLVLDQFGRPMAGVDVEFVITAGGGSLTGANAETDEDGVAMVGAWKLGSATGANLLEARVEGADPVVFTAMAEVGAVARLVLTGAAVQVAGEPQVVTITAMDEFGNTVEAYEGAKNLTFNGAIAAPRGDEPTVTDRNSAAIDFGDPATILFTNGVATTSMALYAVESVTVSATDEDISAAGDDRLPVVVEHAALNDFALVLAPDQINTESFTGTNTLTARDLYHNVVTSFDAATDGVTLTTTLAGTVSGLDTGSDDELEETLSFTSGVANLTGDLTYTGTIGTGTFTATSASGKSGTSGNVTVVPGAATQLVFVTQPDDTAYSGAALAQQPVVRLRDASANDVLTAGVAVEASLNGGGTLDGTGTVLTDANGIATFTALGISGIIGNRTLSFTSGSLPVITSTTIDLLPGAATHWTVETEPSPSVRNAIVFPVQPVLQLRDAAGNAAPEADMSVTVSIATGAALLGGTLSVDSDTMGLATFTDLVITGIIGERTLLFAGVSGIAGVISDTVLVTPGEATQLALSTHPPDTVANDVNFPTQPVVQLRDVSGNDVPEAGVEIDVTITGGNPRIFGDTLLDTDADGAAAFTNLKITGSIGDRIVTYSAASLTSVIDTMTVIAGAATNLTIETQPSDTIQVGIEFPRQPVLQLRDISGNPVPSAGVVVSAGIWSGGGTLQGEFEMPTDANGVATFTDLRFRGTIGPRELVFSADALSGVVSDTLMLTFGPAAEVVITTEPSATAQSSEVLAQQPVVQLRDASGNDADTAGVVITATLLGGGTLNGDATIATDANGVATFTDLGIEGIIGDRTLVFSAGALVPDTSATIDLEAGTATRLVLTGDATVTAGDTLWTTITARDDAGNPALTYEGVKSLTFTGADTATSGDVPYVVDNGRNPILFGSATSITFVDGVATPPILLFMMQAAQLSVSDGTLSSPLEGQLSLVVGHSQLNNFEVVFSSPQENGVAFTGWNTVTARDQYHNPVTSFDASADNVTLSTGLSGVVSGLGSGGNAVLNQASDFSAGRANVAGDLTYTGTIGTSTFTATSVSGSTGTSGDVEVKPGAATKVVFTVEPSTTAQSGELLVQQPVAQLRDQSDNNVPQSGVTITAAILSGGGTLGGDNTIATNASGTATFTDLEISGIIGDRTLEFAATDLVPDTSVTIDLQAGAAAQLTLETSVPDTVTNDVVFSPQPVVQLRDDAGNIVREAGVTVTAAIEEGEDLMTGDQSIPTDANGVATYTNLKITGLVGERVLQFSAPIVTSALDTVYVIAGAATQVVLSTEPSDTVQNARPFPRMPVAQLRDVSGNDVAQAGVAVEVVIASGGAALEGDTILVTDAQGDVAFYDLAFRGTVGERVLSYNASGLSSAVDTMQLIAGLASSLKIQQSPSLSVNVGVAFPVQPIIQIIDISGNAVAQEGVDIEGRVFSGGGQLLGDTIVATDANGTATYTGLNIVGLVGNQRELRFESESLSSPVTQYITVSAGPATQLVLTTQPSDTAQSGVVMAGQPVVQLRDAGGNNVSSAGVTVTARLNEAGTLAGDSIVDTDVNGAATFTDLAINGLIGDRTLTFVADDLTEAVSDSINLQAGAATRLVVTGGAAQTAGEQESITITAMDSGGNVSVDYDGSKTITFAGPSDAPDGTRPTAGEDTDGRKVVVGAAASLSFTNGVVTTQLTLYAAEEAVLTASDGTLSAAGDDQLTILVGPDVLDDFDLALASPQVNGVAFTGTSTITARDEYANVVTSFDASADSVTITTTLPGVVSGLGSAGNSVLNRESDFVNGVADVAGDLTYLGTAGTGTFTATAASTAAGTSATITMGPGAATHVTITTQPSATAGGSTAFAQQPVVELRDASGNLVPTDNVTVTASIASGGGALGGDSTIATVDGVATFTDLEISGALGAHTIEFSATDLATDTSDAVDVTVGPPARLAYVGTIPDTVVAGEEFSFQVAIQDEAGNTVPDATNEVIIGGDEAANAVNGIATFSGLQTSQAWTLTLEATSGTLIPDTTVLVVTHAAASKLAFTTQPSDTLAGEVISPAIVVEVQDEFGNRVTNSTHAITLNRQTPGDGGGLVGDSVQNAVNGVATFDALTLEKASNGYMLAATSSNPTFLTSAISEAFNVTHAPLDNFLVEAAAGGNIGDQVAGTPFNVKVTARDVFNNRVMNYTGTIAFTTTPADGISAGSSAGIATGLLAGHALTFGEGGTFTVTATSGGKTGTSNSFAVTAPPVAVADSVASNSGPGDDFHTALNTNLVAVDGSSEDLLTNDELGFPAGTISSFGAIQTNNGSGALDAAIGGADLTEVGAPIVVGGDGSLQVNANGTFTFDPPTGYTGLFRFQYRLTNSAGTSDGTVTLAVGARPVAVADDYSAVHGNLLGNVPINTATSTDFSVLTNDSGDNKQLFLHSGAVGGTGLIEVDGTFDFNPTAAFEGVASMKYQIYNGFGYSDTVAVSMTFDDVVWFIDAAASAGGNGRYGSPYNCFVGGGCFSAITTDSVADKIFVYSGSYTGGHTLLASQHLVGQGATGTNFASVLGVTWPADAGPQPAIGGTNPTITAASGATALTLGSGNTLRGFTLGNVGATGTALSGNNFGTLTHSGITINTNGRAMELTTGTIAGDFAGITSSGGPHNVVLTWITGATNLGSGALSGATGTGVAITGGADAITYNGTIAKTTANTMVIVQNRTGGTVTFGGNLSCTTSCAGINVTGNTGGTVHFSGATKTLTPTNISPVAFTGNTGNTTLRFSNGGLAISSGTATGINASNTSAANATLLVEGSNNTITSTTGTALSVQNTTIGAAGLTFKSISSNGATNGILLNNTGSSAGLTVIGNGSAGSGGTIQNSTATGISVTGTGAISLSHLNLTGSADDGIGGSTVGGLSLDSVTLSSNGNAVGDRGIDLAQLTGTATISNSTITGSAEDNVNIANTSGSLAMTITNSSFTNTNMTTGNDGILFQNNGSGSMTLSVTNSTFTDNKGDHFQAASTVDATGTMDLTFSNNTLTTTSGNDANVLGGGITISPSGSLDLTFDVLDNDIQQAFDDAINFNLGTGSTSAASMIGTIEGNVIGTSGELDSGSESSVGIGVTSNGAGYTRVAITNNEVYQWSNPYGILLTNKEGTSNLDATVTANTVANPGTFAINGIRVDAGAATGDGGTLCVALTGNTALNSGNGASDIRFRQRFNTTIKLPNYAGGNSDTAAVAAFVSGNNGGATVSAAHNVGGGGGGFINGTCPTP